LCQLLTLYPNPNPNPKPKPNPDQVMCQLVTIAASSATRMPRSFDPVKFFCNSSSADAGEADSVVLDQVRRDLTLTLTLTLSP